MTATNLSLILAAASLTVFAAIASDDFLFEGRFGLIKSWFDAFIHWLDVNGFFERGKEQ